MYQKILVPVSLEREEDGDEALNLAMALKNDGGEVVLLHVAEPIPSYAADAIPPSVLANGRKEVARQLASAAGRAGD
ncbi:MAG: universal stress protein, partial [Pseudomonadota bacterium]